MEIGAQIEPAQVRGVRWLLEEALGNLVDNAFNHGAGRITLKAERRNGAAELHVLDEGKGFPPGFAELAFERFSRAQKTTSDGSGLGLAIVETIAEAHNGTARARNARDGADVWISVPNRPPGSPQSPR